MLTGRVGESNYTIEREVAGARGSQTALAGSELSAIARGFEGGVYIYESEDNRTALDAVLDADWSKNSSERISGR